jgi:hypothetical protein
MAGKPKDIPEPVRKIIAALISSGESDNRVSKLVSLDPLTWKRLARREKSFAETLGAAELERCGNLAMVLRGSMMTQIKKGHPWWAKLAIHNFNVGLRDPDVVTAIRLKRMLSKVIGPAANELLVPDQDVIDANLPDGAIPPDAPDDAATQ